MILISAFTNAKTRDGIFVKLFSFNFPEFMLHSPSNRARQRERIYENEAVNFT